MKTRRIIYIALAVLLIAINLLVSLADINEIKTHLHPDAGNIAYLLGRHFMTIIAIIFLISAWELKKKIHAQRSAELGESIKKIGK